MSPIDRKRRKIRDTISSLIPLVARIDLDIEYGRDIPREAFAGINSMARDLAQCVEELQTLLESVTSAPPKTGERT